MRGNTMKVSTTGKSNLAAEFQNRQANEIVNEWRESAPFWKKHADTIRMMFRDVTQALIEGAQIEEGEFVLDVAGGAGEPSLTIAELVGPNGLVTVTDIAPEMVAAAESEAHRRGLSNVTFKQCAADALPFESNSFDAVISRLMSSVKYRTRS